VERHVSAVSRDTKRLLAEIRKHFSYIIERVLGHKALLSVRVNSEGNLEFHADFFDENELSTSEGDGTSYRKIWIVLW